MKRFKIYSFMLIVIASCKTEAHLITAEKMILNLAFYMQPRELNEPHYMYYINRYFAYKSDEIRRLIPYPRCISIGLNRKEAT